MAETREALIRAGTTLFARDGLDAPSLDAICAKAGKTRGAFYVHFQDRDDLLVAVMDRAGREFLDQVLGGGPADNLGASVARFLKSLERGEYPLMAGKVKPHQLLDACARSPVIRERYVGLVRDSIDRLRGAVQTSQKAGIARSDVDPEQVATILLATVIGAQTMLELGIKMDAAAAARTLLVILRGV